MTLVFCDQLDLAIISHGFTQRTELTWRNNSSFAALKPDTHSGHMLIEPGKPYTAEPIENVHAAVHIAIYIGNPCPRGRTIMPKH